jgi:hypothetical protein
MILYFRCATEEANIISGTDVTGDYICGFAMFLAELYMQFENPEVSLSVVYHYVQAIELQKNTWKN